MNKRKAWEKQRDRTRQRKRTIREREEIENSLIKQGILLVLANLSVNKQKSF